MCGFSFGFILWLYEELEAARTHKSVKTHAGTVSVTDRPWPLTFSFKINGLLGLIVKHLCVKFGGCSCMFLRYRADRQTYSGENPNPVIESSKSSWGLTDIKWYYPLFSKT